MGGTVFAVEEQNNRHRALGSGAHSEGYEEEFVSVATSPQPQAHATGELSSGGLHAVTIGPLAGPTQGAAPRGWERMQQTTAAQHPTRAQQVQPVLLSPAGVSPPYSVLPGGDSTAHAAAGQQQQQQQLVLTAGGPSTRFSSFKSSAARRIDAHLKHGVGSFVLLWASTAVLLFLFLQESATDQLAAAGFRVKGQGFRV